MRQASKYSGGNPGRFAPYSLPLARIKKIMKKSSDDVKMISGEAPIVFAKACELFIKELTLRSWSVTVRGKRRMLHKDDIATAVAATDIFDFLLGMVSDSSRPLEYSGGIVGYSGGQGGGANLSDDA